MSAAHAFESGIASCLRTISIAPPENRRKVFCLMAREAIGYARKAEIETSDIVDRLYETARSSGLVAEHGDDDVQAALAAAMVGTAQANALEIEAGANRRLADEYDAAQERGEVAKAGNPAIIPEGNNKSKLGEIGLTPKIIHEARDIRDAQVEEPGITESVIAAATLHGKPVPPRRYLCEPMIPARTVTLLTGDGGTGKSLIALQLAFAASTALTWLGMPVQPGRVLYLSAEDELDEVHRRLADIAQHHGSSLADLSDLHILPLAGEDAILAAPATRTNIVETTALWRQVVAHVEIIKPALVILDTLADLFAGDENQRAQARQFIGLLRGLALKHDTTVVVLAHPSLTGMASGTGSSGSTGWSNSVRSRLYLARVLDDDKAEPDVDLRVLKSTKANYGRTGDEVHIRWSQGVFAAEQGRHTSGLDRLAADQQAEQVFLDCLRLTLAQGRQFSPAKSVAFAPTNFARMPEAKGYRQNVLALAMERLLAAGKIKVEMVGRPSHQKHVLALVEPAQEDGQ